MISTLNDVEINLDAILNVYVQAPVKEKVWTNLGPEFGKDVSKTAVIVRASYDLKSTGAAFRSHLAKMHGILGIYTL